MERHEKQAIKSLATILIAGMVASRDGANQAEHVVSVAEAIADQLEAKGHFENVWALAGGEAPETHEGD